MAVAEATAPQCRPAAVQHGSPQVLRSLLLVRYLAPAQVEGAEGILDHVLGGSPVAQHHVSEPGHAECVGVVEVGQGGVRVGIVLTACA